MTCAAWDEKTATSQHVNSSQLTIVTATMASRGSGSGSSSSNPKAAPAVKLSEIYPFDKGCQLDNSLDDIATTGTENMHLPGYPRMALSDTVRLTSFLVS